MRTATILLVAFVSLSSALTAQTVVQECSSPAQPFGGASGTQVSISATVEFVDNIVIQDLQLAVDISHTYIADLLIDIVSPQGTSLRLHNSTGGDADDLDLIFSDGGVPNGSQPYDFGGTMQPGTGSMALFAGESTVGTWTLVIEDDFPASDDGVLETWCVIAIDSGTVGATTVTNLVCTPTADGASLSWGNPVVFDSILVTANGTPTTLPGTATSFAVAGQLPGVDLEISVEGVLASGFTWPTTCNVIPFGSPTPLTEKFVLVLIDGLRYSEGLGHPTRAHVPQMDALSAQGTIIEPFTNNGTTTTAPSIRAIMTGVWASSIPFFDTECNENNQASAYPYMQEYYRLQLGRPASECVYVLGPYCPWRGSFLPDYGPDYWPEWIATAGGDDANWLAAQNLLSTTQPDFMTLYLPDTDSAGHGGNWDNYLTAIENADAIVGELWDWLQQDPAYAGITTMLITNDHGRHLTNFQGHGDSCTGCRTIQLLAIGPGIKSGHVSTVPRSIPDIAPTIGALLGFDATYAGGSVMTEILEVAEFVRGDVNHDGTIDLADPIAVLGALFATGATTCRDAGDANDDGAVDISDPTWTLSYLFSGGTAPPPPQPFPSCGVDPTPDSLGCVSSGCP